MKIAGIPFLTSNDKWEGGSQAQDLGQAIWAPVW